MKTLVEVFRLSFSLGGKGILRDVSLTIQEGEWVSVLGPNGAGKTTLLKCLVRIHNVKDGHIKIAGKPLREYRQKDLARQLSYVPQANGLILPFTAHEFLLMARYPYLRAFSFSTKEDEGVVREAFEMTGTGHLAERRLATLSGGERQKISIAAALVQKASILLLDEPATFLDPKHHADVHRLLARVNRERGVGILCVTHDINDAVLTSHRVLALKEGERVFWGLPEELIQNEVLEKIYDKRFQFVKHPQTGRTLVVADGP